MWLHVYSDLFVNIVVFSFSYSLSFFFSFLYLFIFFTLCKHKANTTELHLKVRPTCFFCRYLFSLSTAHILACLEAQGQEMDF